MKIFISGPYSSKTESERMENVMQAIRAGIEVIRRGHTPIIPHLSHFVAETAYHEQGWQIPYEEWMRQAFELLEGCDAILFLAPSPGANRELAQANILSKIVFSHHSQIPEAK